jgi:uncharacterized membrane protein
MVEKSSEQHKGFSTDRINAFTDGVLAIVITILVLGIDLPEDHRFSEQGLVSFLVRISRDVTMCAASFWLIGAYWIQHHAIFHFLKYCNRTLLWLNILFMFPLTLMPFLTKLKAVYHADVVVVPLFGSAFIVSGLILLGIWRFIVARPELIHCPIDQEVIRSMSRRVMIGPLVSLIAIGVSYLNIDLGTVVFCSLPLFYLSHHLVDYESGQ